MLSFAADAVVVLHLAFVAFVVAGGFVALRRPRVAWFHVPAAVWGVLIELTGWTCPLTPLENSLRARAGEAGYSGGFVERYLLPVLYPGELTRTVQIVLATLLLGVNVVAYTLLYRRSTRAK